MVEEEEGVFRPGILALVPPPRRSFQAARATILSVAASLGFAATDTWGSLTPDPNFDNTGTKLADVSVRSVGGS